MHISDWSSDVCSSDLPMETKIAPCEKGRDRENRRQCVGKDMHIGRAEIIIVAVTVVMIGMMIALSVRMFVMMVVVVMMMIGTSHQQQRAHDVDQEAQYRNQRGIAEIDAHRVDQSGDRKSTRLNSSHYCASRMPS